MNIELLKSIYTILSKAIHPSFPTESVDQVRNAVAQEIQKLQRPEASGTRDETKA